MKMTGASLEYLLVDASVATSSNNGSPACDAQTTSEPFNVLLKKGQQQSILSHRLASATCLSDSLTSEHTRASIYALYLGVGKNHDENYRSSGPNFNLEEKYPSLSEETKSSPERFRSVSPEDGFLAVNDLPSHKDEAQVMLDVKRLFTALCQYSSFTLGPQSSYTTIFSGEDIESMRKRLYCLIVRVLRKYPSLNYYQGYHDVASIILLVCNDVGDDSDEIAFQILEAMTLNHLRDFMIKSISLTINHLKLIPIVLQSAEPELFQLLKHTNNTFAATGGMYYDYKFLPALLSILTLFSHDLCNTNLLLLVWDFILGHGSISASIYIYAAFLIHKKDEIFCVLKLDENLAFETVDLDLAHALLSQGSLLAELNELTLAEVLESAARLIQQHNFEDNMESNVGFNVWFKQFNSDSVILTSSRILRIPYSPLSVAKIKHSDDLKALVALQENQQESESIHDAELLQQAFDQIDSLATSINSQFADEETSRLSLMSSLMSLKAVSSELNDTLVNNSASFLKKFTPLESDGNQDKSQPNRRYVLSIYQISLTIGVLSFLVHYFLKQSEFGAILKIASKNFVQTSVRQVGSFSETQLLRLVNKFTVTFNNVRNYELVRGLADVTQVGLGTVKRSIYTISFLQ